MGFQFNVMNDIDKIDEILERRGLNPGGKTQKYFTNRVFEYSKPYAPFRTGNLSEFVVEVGDDYILYNAPYARYQWYGHVMVGRPPKKPTDIPLKYNQSPMRGKEWTLRMWADRGNEITEEVARFAGGRPE